MSELVTRAQFAALLGVDRANVTRWAQEGRIVTVGDRVDVEASRRRLAETNPGTHQHVADRHAATRAAKSSAGAFSDDLTLRDTSDDKKNDQGAAFEPEGAPAGGRLALRKLRELVMREDRLIDLGLLRGELMPREEMDALWHGIGVAERAGAEAMVERLAPRLAACGDAAALAAEIGAALAEERRRVKRMMVAALRQARRK